MTHDARTVLREAGLRPKKSFGQNFLVAESISRAIAAACVHDDELNSAHVVEIGAGTGALTRLLAERAGSVVAIERDRDLVPLLEKEFAGQHVRILEADAQTAPIAQLLGEAPAGAKRVLCGNLPYSITGSLLRLAVENAGAFDRAVFMVQDEVATRLVASPGGKDWGALTVFTRAALAPRRLLRAPPGAFHPPPDVTSAVVELVPLRPPRAVETERFRALVRAAFEARRKTLRNAWKRIAPAAILDAAAEKAGVSLRARGETLDVDDFARVADALGP
jgi:16S rRNA (adenine1518-N6/adenine1519-N6)-dimethyltransferase